MAKIQRKSAKLFGESAIAGIGGIAQFGSLAAGEINYSKDPDIIQALDAYKNGWSDAVTGNKSPAIEDRNALDYLLSYQQAYIMQRGVPEWISTETYYKGSFVSLDNGHMYVSKTDNNINNNPSTDTNETNWIVFPTPQDLRDGLALKADLDLGNLNSTGEDHFTNKNLSNVTSTGIETAQSWMFPDYQNGVDIVIPTDPQRWTAPSNGFVSITMYGQYRNGYRLFSDNGTVIWQVGDDINANTKYAGIVIPIKKGAKLYHDNLGQDAFEGVSTKFFAV